MTEIEVARMTNWDVADALVIRKIRPLGGFFERGMRWKDFISEIAEDLRPYFEAFREYAIRNNIKFPGSAHQIAENGVPLFNDNTALLCSMRAWGDLVAAIWSEEEDRDYCYMDFYC